MGVMLQEFDDRLCGFPDLVVAPPRSLQVLRKRGQFAFANNAAQRFKLGAAA